MSLLLASNVLPLTLRASRFTLIPAKIYDIKTCPRARRRRGTSCCTLTVSHTLPYVGAKHANPKRSLCSRLGTPCRIARFSPGLRESTRAPSGSRARTDVSAWGSGVARGRGLRPAAHRNPLRHGGEPPCHHSQGRGFCHIRLSSIKRHFFQKVFTNKKKFGKMRLPHN